MDMLFSRKRSMSIAARHKEQTSKAKAPVDSQKTGGTLKKSVTVTDKKAGKRKEALDQAFASGNGGRAGPSSAPSAGTRRVDDKAPSLTLDIRNSLMMPGLSQRFSVLLPKLSTAPETSLRSLLASQRAREDGPSLTLEEEELLFAEMRDNSEPYSPPSEAWDGSAPSTAWKSHSTDYLNRSTISTSTSSPSILSQSSDSTVTRDRNALNNSNGSQAASPPSTSSSFTSFRTFGAQQQQEQATKIKSYGFSGRSQMRDETYLRNVGKQQQRSGKGAHSSETTPSDETVPLPSMVSQADDTTPHARSASETSDGTATPISNSVLDNGKAAREGGHSASLSTSMIPSYTPAETQQVADTFKTQERRAKRQSHLAGLTPAQQKRISKALVEIDLRLRREQMADSLDESPVVEDEEVLEAEEEEGSEGGDNETGHLRRPSYTDSDGSFQSQHSAPFPYGISPAKPETAYSIPVEPPSPSRLPPSPRSHNLKAQVEGTADPIPPLTLARNLSARAHLPEPILTPIKTLPAKHVPSPSTSSPSAVSPVPGYIPGQPRPIGSMHRSDGSVSSRSATPTGHTPVNQNSETSSADPFAYLRGHLRAGSTPIHPPPVTSRTSSLSRSRSVSQTPENRLDEDSPLKQITSQSPHDQRMLGEQRPSWTRRPSSNISATSPAMIQEEREDQLEEDIPEFREVAHRRQMSRAAQNPQQHMEQARDALGWSMNGATGDASRAVSEEGHIPATQQATEGLYRTASASSTGSGFEASHDMQDIWGRLLENERSSSEEEPQVLETPSSAVLSAQLTKLSGLGQSDLAHLQAILVEKAKAERQAYRDDSPTISSSPALGSDNLPQRSASLARGQTPLPPSSWRRPSHDREMPSTAPLPTASHSLANMFTPPSAAEKAAQNQGLQHASALNTAKRSQTALVEPPLTSAQTPSAEGHDELIHTPISDQLSRNPSARNPANIREGKVALDEDPEVRRDFEARIAAATAALNRTPTTSGSKLERKPTKKGVFSISGPKLVSSSSNVPTNPLTPPEAPIDASTKKALEKTSGSGKGSGRWRKLGFRSRPSQSGQNTPESATPAPMPRPVTPSKSTTTSPALGPTPKTEKNLAAAIKLPTDSPISPDLDNFKFPPIGNKQPRNPAIRDRPISPPMPYQPTMQQVAEMTPRALYVEPDVGGTKQSNVDQAAKSGDHSHSSSDSTVAKFIESGRALGLNQEQLDQMLVANGMLDRSATATSSRPSQSSVNTSNSLSNSTASVSQTQLQSLVRNPSVSQASEPKAKGGLFRSFSKKKGKAAGLPAPDAPVPKVQDPLPEPRNVVVRRTLLLPHPPTLPAGPTTPTKNKTGSAFESPDSIRKFAGGRKQSIKRKPLNLTREDHELVSSSPPTSAHRRNFSTGTIQSNRSGDIPDNQPGNKGLGFLHPLAGSTRSQGQGHSSSFSGLNSSPGAQSRISEGSKRRSSTGGSLYDLYGGHDADEEEMLAPHPELEGGNDRHKSQAVEICEYADGQVVWSLVNGMRSEEDDEDDYQFSHHSRQDSVSSEVSSGQYESAPAWPIRAADYATPALNLRHRERGPPVQRPETFVYRAASGDVADLIDHLSRDLDASRGRIDIRHLGLPRDPLPGNSTGHSSPFPYSADQSRSGEEVTPQTSPDPRFADPPSPNPPRSMTRPTPPPPIFAPSRTAQVPAGGFSPKRQMMVRQGFAAHRANVSAGGGKDIGQIIGYGQPSPSAPSFGTADSGGQRTVEERLQNLLDRLKEQNDRHETAIGNRI